MTTTANGLALRGDHAPVNVPAGALAIEAGQTAWTTMQAAALGQLGIADAPEGDKQVFLHVAQRTGLDPFAKQIYMIGRKDKKSEKRGNQWVDVWTVKYSIQTGIEGFRVIRSRAERDEGVRGILSEAVYYDGKGQEYDTWYFQQPPVIVKMTYTVRDRNGIETPYVSKLRFDEYRQTRKDGDTQVLSGQWATKPVHMLEKCTEADVYRKAFPQDYSGVDLDDAMPAPDPDAVAAYQHQAPPVADLRQRAAAHTVTAEVVTPEPSPAAPDAPVSGPAARPQAEVAAAGGDLPPLPGEEDAPEPVTPKQLTAIWTVLSEVFLFGKDERDEARKVCAHIANRELASSKDMSKQEAGTVLDTLAHWETQAQREDESPRAYLQVMINATRGEDGEPGE